MKNIELKIIGGFFAVFVLIVLIGFLIQPKQPIVIDRTQAIVDSMKIEANNARIKANDSLIAIYSGKLSTLNESALKQRKINGNLKEEIERLKGSYEPVDTMLTLCDTLVRVQDSLIAGLEIELDTCRATIGVAMDMYYKSDSNVYFLTENVKLKDNQLNAANNTINKLIQSNRRTWWEKNQKWFYLVSGSAVTYFLLKN